jgi:cytochrome c biogenesis protein CcmG, thiol:disulfide interchange protein DsbE
VKRSVRLALAAVLLIVIVGFSWAALRSLHHGASLTDSPLVGKPAPTELLLDIDSAQKTSLAAPSTAVIINFWAPWCAPCAGEHRLLNDAVARYAQQNIRFVGVAYQSQTEAVNRFLDNSGRAMRTLIDPDGRAAIDFGVTGPPETFVVDTHGVVRARVSGAMTAELLDDIVARLGRGETDFSHVKVGGR